jgi:hypothetical protein
MLRWDITLALGACCGTSSESHEETGRALVVAGIGTAILGFPGALVSPFFGFAITFFSLTGALFGPLFRFVSPFYSLTGALFGLFLRFAREVFCARFRFAALWAPLVPVRVRTVCVAVAAHRQGSQGTTGHSGWSSRSTIMPGMPTDQRGGCKHFGSYDTRV